MANENDPQNVILGVSVDTGNSKEKLQELGASVKGMGDAISNAADVSAAALERQGAAQEAAAKASKRSTDSAVRTLQTEIAAREAGGRATARYYELIYAGSTKVDQQAIAPLIARYKALEEQQKAAGEAAKKRAEEEKQAARAAADAITAQAAALKAASVRSTAPIGVFGPADRAALPDISGGTRQLEQMGMTAKATSAALRQVPAQFTDIVVSLQGGQAPLTVFLQQGGQLKDVFGGAGAAAQALGSYLVGLVNPISLAVAAVATIGLAAYNSREDLKALNAVLITTGNRAGTTSAELANIAESISKQGFSFSQGAAALVEFAKAGVNAGDKLGELTKIALDLEKFGGQAVRKTATDFAALGKDPVAASLELNKELGYLSRTTLEYIDRLVKQGDSVKAATVAQEAYADATRRSAAALEANLGPIDIALNYYTVKGKAMWDALRGLVGPDTGNEQFAKLQQQLAGVRAQLADTKPTIPGQESSAQKELLAQEKILLNQINYYTRLNEASRLAGEQEGKRTRQTQLAGEWLAKYASASEKQAATEKRIRSEGIELGKTELEIQKAIALSRGKQSSSGSRPEVKVDENLRELSQYIASLEKRIDTEKQLTEVQKAQNLIVKAATNDANAQVQAYALALAAEFDLENQKKASTAALKKYNDELGKSADSVEKTVQKYKDESAAATLVVSKRISLEAAINDVTIARLEEQLVIEKIANNSAGEQAVMREIELRKELGKEIRSKDARTETEKVAKDAASAWEKASNQISQSITDSLMRGFESGKGFAENLRDTTVNMFKSMVLEPTIRASVQSGLSALGIGGKGGGGLLSGLGSAYSAYQSSGSLSAGFASLFGGGTATALSGYGTTAATGYGASGVIAGGNLGVGAGSGAAAGGASSGLAAIPVAGWIAMGMLASSDAYDEGYRANTDFSNPIKAVLDPNTVLDLTDGLLQSLGIDGKTASILSGSALGAKLADFLSGGGEYVQSLGESVATVVGNTIGLGGSGGNNDVSIGGGLNIRQTEQSDKFTGGLASAFIKAASALGIATTGATFGAGFNNSDGGKFAVEATVGGKKYDPGQVKYTDANLALEASRAVFFALQSSELPGYLSKVFDDVNVSAASQVDIDAALNYASGLKQVRDALTETRTPLEILKSNVDAAFTTLGTSADTFKTDFVAAIDAGISPDKLAQFQALGQQLDALAASSGTAATAVRSLADIAQERAGLQSQLDELTLSATELLAKQRDELDASNRALFDQVQAAQAAKDAQEALAEATQRSADQVASAIGSLTDTRFDLENQLLSLQGNAAAVAARVRESELSGLTAGVTNAADAERIKAAYDYNESLRAQVDSINAARAAAEAQARFQAQLAQDYAQSAQEQARAQAQAAQDLASAAERAQAAMKTIADSVTSEIDRIRGVTRGESAGGFAAAQALFAIGVAQAKSGDTAAFAKLPELSKAVTDLAVNNTATSEELRSIRANTAQALEDVVRQYGFAVPAAQQVDVQPPTVANSPVFYNSMTTGGVTVDNAAVLSELQALKVILGKILIGTDKTGANTESLYDKFLRVTQNGVAMQVAADTPLNVKVI